MDRPRQLVYVDPLLSVEWLEWFGRSQIDDAKPMTAAGA